jgi:hypothetical protein
MPLLSVGLLGIDVYQPKFSSVCLRNVILVRYLEVKDTYPSAMI